VFWATHTGGVLPVTDIIFTGALAAYPWGVHLASPGWGRGRLLLRLENIKAYILCAWKLTTCSSYSEII